jgi:hypothetical protein
MRQAVVRTDGRIKTIRATQVANVREVKVDPGNTGRARLSMPWELSIPVTLCPRRHNACASSPVPQQRSKILALGARFGRSKRAMASAVAPAASGPKNRTKEMVVDRAKIDRREQALNCSAALWHLWVGSWVLK